MKTHSTRHSLLFLVAATSQLAAVSGAYAQSTLYWDASPGTADGVSQGGLGTWDTATGNWDNGGAYQAWNNGNNDTAVFAGTAGTVTINTLDDLGVTVGGLTFSSANYILAGAVAGEKLTFGTAGDIANSGTATISAVIAGSATITKTGAGTLNLTATNTFTGNTVISAGTLVVGGNNTAATLGPANYAGNITINGTLLQFTNSTSQNLSGIISGTGSLQKAGSGTLTLSGANTYTGKTIIAASGQGGPTVSVSSFNSVDIANLDPNLPMPNSSLGAPTTVANGTIQLGSGTNVRSCTLIYTGSGETTDRVMDVRFNSGAKHTITSNATGGGLLKFTSNFTIDPSTGSVTGGLTLRGSGKGEIAQIGTIPGILEKNDGGTWTLGGTNASDVVTVAAGTLFVNGTLTARNATPSINVNGTSTLGGSGTLTATTPGTAIVTLASGANLTPGASLTPGSSVGTLTVDGNLNISTMGGGAGVINMELGPIAGSDKIVAGTVNIGAGAFGFSDFVFTGLTGLENGTYKLIQTGGITGSLDGADLSGSVGAGTGILQTNGGDIELVVSGLAGGSPEIAINQGGDIANGDPKDFGTVTLGGTPASLTFTIQNSGTAALTLNGTAPNYVVVSGTNAADFTVTAQPSSASVAAGDLTTTTFTVRFAPLGTSSGTREAVLTIANNDSDEGTFTIDVSGTAQTKYQAWSSGAAFDADANGDGVDNGLAFLLGAPNPNAAVTLPIPTEINGDLVLVFPCLTDANRGGAKLFVQHSSDVGVGDDWLASDFVGDSPGAALNGVTLSVNPGSPTNTVTATIDDTQAAGGKLFGRLKAENP